MQRYTVIIVSPGTTGERPVLLIAFQPSALVTAFIEEIYKRVARQIFAIASNTHVATLHLDSETGRILDAEDLLEQTVLQPTKDKIYAVFENKITVPAIETVNLNDTTLPRVEDGKPALSVCVITPATAGDLKTCPILRLPTSATVRQLHESIADKLSQPRKFDDDADKLECNCKLAKEISDHVSAAGGHFYVVYGKSEVELLTHDICTEAGINTSLRLRFGVDIENTHKVVLHGAEGHIDIPLVYKKTPVAIICSKKRHTSVHARVDVDDTDQRRYSVLDLHTSELPIHPACMPITLDETGLEGLAVDGIVDIFAVPRRTTGIDATVSGKNNIFRARAHWEPPTPQSDRGMAMFLSSLRVFASLVEDMNDDDAARDAVLHTFDLLTRFPPALRTVRILTEGKTPTAVESAALTNAMFHTMDDIMAKFTNIIGTDHTRVFEGCRLFFGSLLAKARSLKLSAEQGLPSLYLDSLREVDIRDLRTNEAVMHCTQTNSGLVETCLFKAFQSDGLLCQSDLQTYMVASTEPNPSLTRHALLCGGSSYSVLIYSRARLLANYRYVDNGVIENAVDIAELAELGHLAELCGRNGLAVYKPTQLASAKIPSLSYDREAHLGVYTGEMPCSDPGESSKLFRPRSGERTVNAAVVEQVIAPKLAAFEADGTAVFDAFGGAAVKKLETPDEVVMFCVDCSASMGDPTDFAEVNEPDDAAYVGVEAEAQGLVEAECYSRAALDEVKEGLTHQDGFQDMLAIVRESNSKRHASGQVLRILRMILSSQVVAGTEKLGRMRETVGSYYHTRQQLRTAEAGLSTLKTLWAGLQTHEEALLDFLTYRATTLTHFSRTWTWTIGNAIPAGAGAVQNLPSLHQDITEIPHELRCPVSHTLMLDAVKAKDGQLYSHAAITRWFEVRHSSPLTGLPLQDVSLESHSQTCTAAQKWVDGGDISGLEISDERPLKRARPGEVTLVFHSREGSFQRTVSQTLLTERTGPLRPHQRDTISSKGLVDGDHVTIRIAEDEPANATALRSVSTLDKVLIKVYKTNTDDLLFAYWTTKDTSARFSSILWKYWRHRLSANRHVFIEEQQIWTDLSETGDGHSAGHPQEHTESVSKFLNRGHCSGILGAESVFENASTAQVSFAGPLVLKVKVNPFWRPKAKLARLSRLDVLKQMFEALINRIMAYRYKTHIGLVTFDSVPKLKTSITHVLENLRKSISDMRPSGDTALWDALALCKDQLVEYHKKYPYAQLRLICISDGQDTKSVSNTAADICWRLRDAGVVMDSVSLGDEDNADLKTISYALGS